MALDRYDRQMRLPGFGREGQERLRSARILVAGCGALGTVVSEHLVRAGVGTVELVDRDLVEWTNLQRQTLFTETDARRGTPKAEAAKARLASVNAEVTIRAVVADLGPDNALALCERADLIVDCLDNFETRYVLNDCAVALGVPLVHGGAVGFRGTSTAILPSSGPGAGRLIQWTPERSTPCLACLAPEPPAPGEVETCDAAGVLAPAAGIVGSIEAALALRLVAESSVSIPPTLVRFDLASFAFASASSASARDPDCRCCAHRRFLHLAPPHGESTPSRRPRVLCGRGAVEVCLGGAVGAVELLRLRERLARWGGEVVEERFGETVALRAGAGAGGVDASTRAARGAEPPSSSRLESCSITVLAGPVSTLAIVDGTTDPELARAIVARGIGA